MRKKHIIITHNEEANLKNFFISAAEVEETVYHEDKITVRVEVLCVKHARCDASEAADVGVAISDVKDAVIIP